MHMRGLGSFLILVAIFCFLAGLLHVTETEAEKNFAALSPIGPVTQHFQAALEEQAKRCQNDKTIPATLCDQVRYQAEHEVEHAKGANFAHRIMIDALRHERKQRMVMFFIASGVFFLIAFLCFWRAKKNSPKS